MADFSVNTIRVNNSGGRTLLENWVEEVSIINVGNFPLCLCFSNALHIRKET